MSGHTPGPWKISAECQTIIIDDRSPFGNGVLIASCMGNDHSGFYATASQANANASLIAAAPELLEACKSALDWLQGWESAEPFSATLRAAIAKATGDQP